jgi:hypothetical protein
MISITGHTYHEVFGNIATDDQFDASERRAAAIIAEDIAACERWSTDRDGAVAQSIEDGSWYSEWEEDYERDHPRPVVRHHVHKPISDVRNFDVHGTGIRFHVRPYTTTGAMNVAVV